ncbi:MAG: hypothetical protein ACLFRG_21130 [Desulfococcaceae bacterium]
MKGVIVALAILGVAAAGALNYHFVLLDDNLKILRKTKMTLEDTFVDARGTQKLKLLLKPALIEAGIKDALKKEGVEAK